MSSIGWVDFSEVERQRTLRVLRLLDEPGTLDALGIGRIRDAFSDLLFPGTSTIQSRARYFLIIPWLCRDLELRSPRPNPGREFANKERGLIEKFNAAREAGGDGLEGLIGSQAGAEVQQLPSSTYWAGLEAWGIRLKSGPLRVFLREVGAGKIDRMPGPEDEMSTVLTSWWDRSLPAKPDDLLENPTLELGPEEASYLREAIAVNKSGSLLAHLVKQDEVLPSTNLAWELPGSFLKELPEMLRQDVAHAERFSFLVYGAHTLYYLMLAELNSELDEANQHQTALGSWQSLASERRSELIGWFGDEAARSEFWATVKRSNPRVPGAFEKQFVESWFDLAIRSSNANSDEARELLTQRELALKSRSRARLSNASAREYWTGASQVGPLDFRWGTVKRHLADIQTGLRKAERLPHA